MPVNCYTTYAGKKCMDPVAVRRFIAQQGLPELPELAETNGYRCPRGAKHGLAHVLLSKQDLTSLGAYASGDLVFRHGDTSLTIKGLRAIDSRCVTNAADSFDTPAYLVTLADARYFLNMDGYAKSYNVRTAHPTSQWAAGTPAATQFDVASLNGGSVWTWATLIADLYNSALFGLPGIGVAPTLPYTPTGIPENYRFYGVNTWAALNTILDKLGCTIVYKPESGDFEIVRNSDTQTGLATFISDNAEKIIYEESPRDNTQAHVPASIVVYFPRRAEHHGTQDDWRRGSTFYARRWESYSYTAYSFGIVNVIGGTEAAIWDDMPAIIGPTGTHRNTSECEARAAEVAENYARARAKLANQKSRRYTGVLSIRPGSELSSVAWKHTGRRMYTTIDARNATTEAAVGHNVAAENLLPPDDQRHTLDAWPNVMQWVEAIADTSFSGLESTATPNADGFYSGVVRQAYPTTTPAVVYSGSNSEKCFFVFGDGYLGDVEVVDITDPIDKRYRYLGRQAGVVTTTPTGGGASETRPLYILSRTIETGVTYQGYAKTNWKKQTAGTGNQPSRVSGAGSEQHGYVDVDNVEGFADTSKTFRVYLPTMPREGASISTQDPNVLSGQAVSFTRVQGMTDPDDATKPYYEAVGGAHVDLAIGLIRIMPGTNDTDLGTPWEPPAGYEVWSESEGRYLRGEDATATMNVDGEIVIPKADVIAAIDNHSISTTDISTSAGATRVVTLVAGSDNSAAHVAGASDITITEPYARPKTLDVRYIRRYDNAAN